MPSYSKVIVLEVNIRSDGAKSGKLSFFAILTYLQMGYFNQTYRIDVHLVEKVIYIYILSISSGSKIKENIGFQDPSPNMTMITLMRPW